MKKYTQAKIAFKNSLDLLDLYELGINRLDSLKLSQA